MRRLVGLLMVLAGLGCATREHAGPPPSKDERVLSFGATTPEPGQPDEVAALDLLTRGFLVRGESVGAGFGYYAYLVFLDAGESTRPQREAAVKAFARMLEDVRDVESLQVPRERLAVLYVPVSRDPYARGPEEGQRVPKEPPTPEKILALYDYSMAQLLTVEIERRGIALPRSFLLGSASPILPRATTLPADLRVVELKGDQKAIETTVLRFRSSLLAPGRPAFASALLERVRAFFDSVGGFVLSVGSTSGSPGSP